MVMPATAMLLIVSTAFVPLTMPRPVIGRPVVVGTVRHIVGRGVGVVIRRAIVVAVGRRVVIAVVIACIVAAVQGLAEPARLGLSWCYRGNAKGSQAEKD